jgi:hypothetical protein
MEWLFAVSGEPKFYVHVCSGLYAVRTEYIAKENFRTAAILIFYVAQKYYPT